MTSASGPADGERRAASGLRNQYAAAARIILDALDRSVLQEVRVADPKAGRVDDLQVIQETRLDAYQVKWQQYPGSLTLGELTGDRGTNPSLIAQLSDGWRRLRAEHPTRRVVVHLLTNALPSASQALIQGEDAPRPAHLAAFIAQAWQPAFEGESVNRDGRWGPLWRDLIKASKLDFSEFESFVRDCALDFGAPPASVDADHEALSTLLFETAASARRIVRLTRAELIRQLGWERRFALYNRHEFDIPKFYQPISETVAALQERLTNFAGGYLSVVGPPGSGKSTLLTRTLRTLPVRLIRYYAFVQESQDPTALRGEAINFLHDVTVRIVEAGFGRPPRMGDRSELIGLFGKQLKLLGGDYAETGTRTVLLIDGLDHIEREQNPERSLLLDLPLPDQIPDGVFIILGTQRTDLVGLPPAVRRAAENGSRRVAMARLAPAAVDAITTETVPGLDAKNRSRVVELTGGHPLTLIYLLKQLQQAGGSSDRESILSAAVPYTDDLNAYYESHWHRVQADDELVHTLALLSRVRGAIDMAWASTWIDRPAARRLETAFGPYFDRDAAGRWAFFHNSFRLFLQARTALPVLGQPTDVYVRELHRELARLYARGDGPARPDTLYHLVSAGDLDEVIALATTDWFLDQLRRLRPIDAVQTDVKLALRAAGEANDPLAVVRLTLLAADLDQRAFLLSQYALAERLLDLGNVALAIEAARDGDRLRIEAPQALALAVRLADAGFAREGARLFELAEPYELLAGHRNHPGSADRWKILEAWATAAPRFRSSGDVLSSIPAVPSDDEKEDPADVQRWLLIKLGSAAAGYGLWRDWWRYLRALRALGRLGLFDFHLASVEAASASDPDRARTLFRSLLRRAHPDKFSDDIERALDVAEIALVFDPTTAEAWSGSFVPLPIVRNTSLRRSSEPHPVQRFRLYRLRYALDERRAPEVLVEADVTATISSGNTGGTTGPLARRLALATTTLAALWGRGYRGDNLPPRVFVREVEWIVHAFVIDFVASPNVRIELGINPAQVLDMVVQAAAKHGRGAVEAVVHHIGVSWKGQKVPHLRRKLAQSLANVDALDLARLRVADAEADLHSEPPPNPRDRVDTHWDQASAWLNVREPDAARHHLLAMIEGARGPLDDHDHQLEVWVRWMARANSKDPDRGGERIQTMLRRLAAIEASGITDAASELVATAAQWSPRRAVALVQHLQELGLLDHSEALGSFVDALCRRTDPPVAVAFHVVRHLLIPIGGPGRTEMPASLLSAVAKYRSREDAIHVARHLAERVRAEAIPTDRPAWFGAIARGLESLGIQPVQAGLSADEAKSRTRDSGGTNDPVLKLTDGRDLTLEEARDSIGVPEDFEVLATAEDKQASRFYHWRSLAEIAVARVSDLDQIGPLAEVCVRHLSNREAALTLVELAGRARELGDGTTAVALATRALNLSDPMGWDPWMDGGSRIGAYEVLCREEPGTARPAAVQRFAQDLATTSLSAFRLIHHAERLIPLLFEEVPVLDIWSLVERYLDDLFHSSPVVPLPYAEQAFNGTSVSSLDDTSTRALADAVALYLDHPAYSVAARATGAAAAMIVASPEEPSIAAPLLDAARKSEAAAERVLAAVEAAAIEQPLATEPYMAFLDSLGDHPDVFLRLRAAKILSRIRREPTALVCKGSDLPAIFTLELPPLSLHETGQSETSVLIDDPARILRPIDIEARALAQAAGVDEDAVLLRAKALHDHFRTQHIWICDDQEVSPNRLSRFLEGAGLRIAHAKPHIEPAERALKHIAGELWDARHFPFRDLRVFERLFTKDDPGLILRSPIQRPLWLPQIGGLEDDERVWRAPDGWLESASDSLALLLDRTPDGRIILAESTQLAFLGSDTRIEEIRFSVVRPRTACPINRAVARQEPPFFGVDGLPMEAYQGGRTDDGSLVIYAEWHRAETPGMRWAALDPGMARDLGWTYDTTGLGRWLDSQGQVAVETIWWTDGSPDRYDWRRDCTVGEGWIVLASPAAADSIRSARPLIRREGVVHRRLGHFGTEGHQAAHRTLSSF